MRFEPQRITSGTHCQNRVYRSVGEHRQYNGIPNSDVFLPAGSEDITFERCRFESSNYCAVSMDQKGKRLRQITFRDCHFLGNYSRHLMLYHLADVRILNCHFSRSNYDAIRILDNVDNVLVDGCTFTEIGINARFGQTADCIDIRNSGRHFRIVNNRFDRCRYSAIDVKNNDPTSTSGNMIISGNQISGCCMSGICLNGNAALHDVRISGNMIETCGNGSRNSAGILIKGPVNCLSITGNHCYSNNGRGISVINRSNTKQNLLIESNVTAENLHENYINMIDS